MTGYEFGGIVYSPYLSPPPVSVPSVSAPDVLSPIESEAEQKSLPEPTIGGGPDSNIPAGARQVDYSIGDSIDRISSNDLPLLDEAGRPVLNGISLDARPGRIDCPLPWRAAGACPRLSLQESSP